MKILLEGPILTQSGYGEHTRLVYRSIQSFEGLEIFINPLNWGATGWISEENEERRKIEQGVAAYAEKIRLAEQTKVNPDFDIQIHVGIPNEFQKKAPYSVCVTAGIETDRVSAEWLMKTHQGIDKLIVPSEHAALGFKETSYEVQNETKQIQTVLSCACPVEVVHYPVKEIEPDHLDFTTTTSFNFLSMALMGPRKNQENLVKWFVEKFKDNSDVGLILKTSRASGSVIDREATKSELNKILRLFPDRKCKIYLLHGDLTEKQVHSLYVREDVKAYVTATHGEGYGLPLFEAAYSGLPIIATNWSGHLDFLSAPYKENGKTKEKMLFAKVDYDLAKVQPEARWNAIITDDSQWAFAKEASFKSQLEKVYKNHGMYKKWAAALKQEVLKNFSEGEIYNKMANALLSDKLTETKEQADNEMEIVQI